MKRTSTRAALIALALNAAFATVGHAQSSGGPYEIKASVIAGGGSPIAGGSFQITSTIGQAATTTLSGAGFVVVDGYWAPVGSLIGDLIFANGFDSL